MKLDLNFKIIEEVLLKDIDKKSTEEILTFLKNNVKKTMEILKISKWETCTALDKIKVLLLLGLGRDRTIYSLSEFKINRSHIKEAKENMNKEQTELRINNEKVVTNFKIDSTKRKRRIKLFEEADVEWETIAEKYLNGESVHKLASEYNLKVNTITDQLKDDGIHDETRSTILKHKKANELENFVDDEFIIDLVKNNPLDSKDLWWEKAKEKYPWLLRRQMFDKLKELGLERTKDEVNEIKRIKNEVTPCEIKKDNKEISPQAVKANTIYKINKTFGSVDNLVELFMNNKIGRYTKISNHINKSCPGGLKVSKRQVEKIITRHSNYESKQSLTQLQLLEFVKNTFKEYEVIHEYPFTDTGKRIDVFIKELNIGIEFNGDYWHSDEVVLHNYGIPAEVFHKERVKETKKLGIDLYYVWENDWENNYEEVEKCIKEQNWEDPILNRYTNKDYFRTRNTIKTFKSKAI